MKIKPPILLFLVLVQPALASANQPPEPVDGPAFWEQQWQPIRQKVIRNYPTGCLAKFANRPECVSDPIKDDLIGEYGRALVRGDYPEATRLLVRWAQYLTLISRETAQVYDLALTSLAVTMLLEEDTEGSFSFLDLFIRTANAQWRPPLSPERVVGLQVALNPAIMTCDLVRPNGNCLFEQVVRSRPLSFMEAVQRYSNDLMGIQCLDRKTGRVNRYTERCDQDSSGIRVCRSVMARYLGTYLDPSRQGNGSCPTCQVIANNFLCTEALPPCLEEAIGDPAALIPPTEFSPEGDGGEPSSPVSDSLPTSFAARMTSGFSSYTSQELDGILSFFGLSLAGVESLERRCNPLGNPSEWGDPSLAGLAGACRLSAGDPLASSDPELAASITCVRNYRETIAPTTPEGLEREARRMANPWPTIQDPDCLTRDSPGVGRGPAWECYRRMDCRRMFEEPYSADQEDAIRQVELDIVGEIGSNEEVRNAFVGACILPDSICTTEFALSLSTYQLAGSFYQSSPLVGVEGGPGVYERGDHYYGRYPFHGMVLPSGACSSSDSRACRRVVFEAVAMNLLGGLTLPQNFRNELRDPQSIQETPYRKIIHETGCLLELYDDCENSSQTTTGWSCDLSPERCQDCCANNSCPDAHCESTPAEQRPDEGGSGDCPAEPGFDCGCSAEAEAADALMDCVEGELRQIPPPDGEPDGGLRPGGLGPVIFPVCPSGEPCGPETGGGLADPFEGCLGSMVVEGSGETPLVTIVEPEAGPDCFDPEVDCPGVVGGEVRDDGIIDEEIDACPRGQVRHPETGICYDPIPPEGPGGVPEGEPGGGGGDPDPMAEILVGGADDPFGFDSMGVGPFVEGEGDGSRSFEETMGGEEVLGGAGSGDE